MQKKDGFVYVVKEVSIVSFCERIMEKKIDRGYYAAKYQTMVPTIASP
jgi:hypothetical protein